MSERNSEGGDTVTANAMTINEIAEKTETSAKTIRAFLRANHARSSELKNSRWGNAKQGYVLSAKLTSELVERYTASTDEASE